MDFPPTLRSAGKRFAGTASTAYNAVSGAARGAFQGMRNGMPSVPEIPAGPIKAAGQKVASAVTDGYKAAASYIPESVSTPVVNAGKTVADTATNAYQAARGLRMPGMTPSAPFPTLNMGMGGPELPAASPKVMSPLEGMIAKGQSAMRSATIPGMTGRASTPFPTIDPAMAVPPAPAPAPAAPVAPPASDVPAAAASVKPAPGAEYVPAAPSPSAGYPAPRPVGPPATPVGPGTPGYVAPRDPRLVSAINNGGYVETLTSQIDPLNRPAATPMGPVSNPSMQGGMSPERMAYETGRMGPPAPAPEPAPGIVTRGMRAAGNVLGMSTDVVDRAMAPIGKVLAPIANAANKVAAPLAIGTGLYDTYKGGSEGDTARAVGGIADATAGAALYSPATAPVAGAWLGGRMIGGVANALLPESAKDAIGGTINGGMRMVGSALGQDWGADDSAYLAQRAAAGNAPAASAQAAAPAAAGNAPAAPATQDDITSFNARMGQVGAGDVGMRAMTADEVTRANAAQTHIPLSDEEANLADRTPASLGMRADANTRVLYNTKEASADKQAITDQRMADRTSQVAAQDAQANAQQNERFSQLATDARTDAVMRRQFDSGNYDADINAAKASGSAVRIQQAYSAREAAQRSFETGRQTDAQTVSSMRGHDVALQAQGVTERDAIRSNNTAQVNGMRTAAIAQRSYNLDERKFNRDVTNDTVTQGEAAEKHLDDALTSRFTNGTDKDGKPQIDVQAKNDALAGIQRSAAALGANSVKDLSKPDRERLIAGADLAAKVNKDATNWPIPWRPDVIGAVMPHDLIGLQRNSSGDYVVPRGAAKGRVIPARYLDKVGADHFYGQPTDIYDNLKAR